VLKVILADIESLVNSFKTVLLVIVLVALTFWVARCTAAKDAVVQERITTLTHEVKVATPVYITDTVIAYKARTRYDSARVTDTVMRHDSVFVLRSVADTAINACTVALHDCEHIRLLNDSLTKQLVKQKPGFWSHLGCTAGPAILAKRDGTVVAGVGATCGWRIWP
jgi:hypothetical protein